MRNYAAISSPLTELLKQKEPNARVMGKEAKFVCTDAADEAFESLKAKQGSEPALVRFVPERPTELHTDTSCAWLGAILLQEDGEKRKRLTYAVTRRLSKSELNYHSTKLEQLAAVWAMLRLRHHSFGRPLLHWSLIVVRWLR